MKNSLTCLSCLTLTPALSYFVNAVLRTDSGEVQVEEGRDGTGQDHSGRTLDIGKEETTGLSNKCGLGCERKNGIKGYYKIWDLNYWKDRVAIN